MKQIEKTFLSVLKKWMGGCGATLCVCGQGRNDLFDVLRKNIAQF
jgi:hypothetical protein